MFEVILVQEDMVHTQLSYKAYGSLLMIIVIIMIAKAQQEEVVSLAKKDWEMTRLELRSSYLTE